MVIYRIKSSDFSVCELIKNSCKKSSKKFPEAIKVAELFKAHNKLKEIIDKENPKFLKGSFSKDKILGARINILPSGEKIDKSYSLFSPRLTIHDEKSSSHWDVIFQMPNGKMAYAYTLEKNKISENEKYKKVDEFERYLPKLKRNLSRKIGIDSIVLPMIILLKTKMRVGNEMYYKKNSHKGLTTLKKKDILISKNSVTFDYVGKDGVPQKVTESFSEQFVKELRKILSTKKQNDFVFVDKNGHPLKDIEFEKAFKKYCGKKFYPHIVRSHFATEETIKFLKKNSSPTKEQVKKFYLSLAKKLGHKKYSKKNKEWEDSYQITLHHYINPKLIQIIDSRIK